MTNKELIEVLKTYPEDMPIYISRDVEGNNYFPVDEITQGFIDPDSLEEGLAALTPELEAEGYTEDDVVAFGENCIFIYPDSHYFLRQQRR